MPVPEAVEAATTYDAALSAFEALPESPDERPAEDAPAAVASSEPAAVAVGEPAAQVAAQPDADEARAKAEIDALLDRPVPATAEFPKLFHGQPMRKLVASMAEQDRFITKISEEKSLMHDELVAAQAAARVLMQRGGQPAAATTPAAPKPTDDTAAFFQRHGVEDPFKEFTKDPTVFFHKLVKFALADAKEETRTLVEPLGQTVTATQNRERLTVAQNAVNSAFAQICQEDRITDPEMLKKAKARFDQLFGSEGGALAAHVGRTADIYNPASWLGAYRNFEKAVGGFPPLVAPPAALPTNTTKANPPSSARAGASVIGGGGKTVSGRRSAAVRSLFENSGLPDVENLMAQVENEIDGHLKTGYLEK